MLKPGGRQRSANLNIGNFNKIIYTALFGAYDKIRDPLFVNPDWQYVAFTDQPVRSNTWKVVPVRKKKSNARMNRFYKAMSHFGLACCDISVYLDANIQQTKDINLIVDQMQSGMLVMKHPTRNCVYDEFEACKKQDKDSLFLMSRQIERYKKEGYPKNNGLAAGGLIVRKHTKAIKEFNQRWWKEIQENSHRDQLSFNYCLSSFDMLPDYIPFDVLQTHFKRHNHEQN